VFLHREKTLARKVQEVLLTWWIESAMDKQSIIQLYLNVIEYGPNVYGIRNAAAHYFGCTPDQLTPAQSAYLAMILPNPTAFHSQWEQGQVPDSFRRRVARFVRLLGERGRYDAEAVVDGLGELEHFRLVRPGESPACRRANGHTTPLPVAAGQPDDQEPVEEEPETEDSGWDEW
jgi:membrane peptidoglycan carboxypeptidase